MRILTKLWRLFLFFALLAFAMNNSQPATVNWFFSTTWTAPMVIVVLVAFTFGAVVGVLAMTPSWWHHRSRANRLETPAVAAPTPTPATTPALPDVTQVRDGL